MTKFESKYSIGDEVVQISTQYLSKIVKCYTCTETGKITINTEEFVCPKCKGQSAHHQFAGNKWVVYLTSRVGKIEISQTTDKHQRSNHFDVRAASSVTEVKYMLEATGVGSSNVYDEEELFSTREEAQAECDRRNFGADFSDTGTLRPAIK